MHFTREQLSKMSDFQVDRDTAIKAFGEDNVKVVQHRHELDVLVLKPGLEHVGFIGFCPTANWRDVMPIAEKYEISINMYHKTAHTRIEFSACSGKGNLKRAICEVFLMMETKK